MKRLSPIFLFVVFLLFAWEPSGVCQPVVFNKVAPPDGNSFNFVSGITQDLIGNMWFATKIGLVRYDGNQLTAFKNNPINPNSLLSNNLESILADSDGTIWIGSLGQGLDHFDPLTGNFTHYHHDSKIKTSLVNDTVTAILRDKQGILWIGTHGGLDRFDPKTNTFSHYSHNANDLKSLSNNQVRALYEDRQGTLWIGTGSPYASDGGGSEDGGLNRMNQNSGTFTRYLHDSKNSNSLSNNKVTALYEDNNGVFWVGTAKNGLHKMDRKKGTFERIVYDPAHPEKLSGPPANNKTELWRHITFITQDAAGSYWIGSSQSGVNYYNSHTRKIINYRVDTTPSTGFTDIGGWKAFTSRDGIFWIACPNPGGNIYRINPLRKELPHYQTTGGNVNSFFEEPNGTLWIGTDRQLIHKDNEIVKQYLKSTGVSKTNALNVCRIIEDRQGNIWIGSGMGLTKLNKGNNTFHTYKYEPGNPNSLSNHTAFSIKEDSDGNLWIGTMMGLNLLDRKTGLFTRYFIYPDDTIVFGKNFITSICEDKTGKLWTSTWSGGGVSLFNRDSKQFKTYLKGINIVCIYEDMDGALWVCAERGLYKFDKGSDNFFKFSDPTSLTEIPNIFSMVEDNQGNLWLGTSDGIARINRERNNITYFGKNYGVGNNGMSYGASYKGRDGKLYFGDTTGYFLFDPAQIVKSRKPPEISISGFRLADKAIQAGDGGPLKESLLQAKEIRLRYNQNVFSFELNVIDYADPEQNRFFYLLENYETDWHQANSDRKAYYFNIPPGKYIFYIKAVNGYGVWAEKKITVFILPPWWRTWWAYSIYALLLIAVIFGFDRFMRRRIVLVERQKAQKRELEQAREIEKAYTELKATQTQLIQSEKMASLGELTAGIAHEIQNPLNFVNNFSEVNTELIEEMKQEIEKGNMDEVKSIANDIAGNEQKITQHGKRADSIVKGMLLHSRSSSGVKEPTNINAIADEYLRLAYHGLRAKDKSFNATMKTDFDQNIGSINVIPQDIGRVILNLITNAFYAVTEKKSQQPIGYEPTVSVSTKKVDGRVEIKVKDNGNGIPQKVLDKIYQPFFTTKPSGQGTGLGLSMSYEIVTKAHGGELKVDTKEGEGAEFTIILTV